MITAIKLSPGTPNYRQRTVLDGVEYTLVLRWSQSESRWYLDLRDQTGELLIGCMKLVVNFPLLRGRRRHVDGLPQGELFVADNRPFPADPGLDELGDSHRLEYIDAATLAELEAAA